MRYTALVTLPKGIAAWRRCIDRASKRRASLIRDKRTTAYRLVSGAGDDAPGVDVDVYGEHLVISLSTEQSLDDETTIVEAFAERAPEGIYVKRRPKKASTLVDTRRDEIAPILPVFGNEAPSPLVVLEHGVRYETRLGDGLSTGIFLDQRQARKTVRALSKNARVANLFCYHAAFTVAAIAGGCRHSVSVDTSGVALDRARDNINLAGGSPDQHRLSKRQARAWLRSQGSNEGEALFDLIIIDPPSFSSSKRGTFRVDRDYPELITLAAAAVNPGGALLACCNMHRMPMKRFAKKVRAALGETDRRVASLEALDRPIDFRIAPGQEHYQKNMLVRFSA